MRFDQYRPTYKQTMLVILRLQSRGIFRHRKRGQPHSSGPGSHFGTVVSDRNLSHLLACMYMSLLRHIAYVQSGTMVIDQRLSAELGQGC